MRNTMTQIARLLMISMNLLVSHPAGTQAFGAGTAAVTNRGPLGANVADDSHTFDNPPVVLPATSPDLAMQVYHQRTLRQAERLAGFSATTTMHVELPDLARKGEYVVRSHYLAPCTLEFNSVHFSGDSFVKASVMVRMLQSEADHVRKREGVLTALTSDNYKFSQSETLQINGRPVHAFDAKPRGKRSGLFRGRIYLNRTTGALVRAEGTFVKTPSFFIKKISFVQDYAEFGDFTFPVHVHVVALTRVLGRAVVDIYHRDYQSVSANPSLATGNDGTADWAQLPNRGRQIDPQAFSDPAVQ